jgi:hypothetical protein
VWKSRRRGGTNIFDDFIALHWTGEIVDLHGLALHSSHDMRRLRVVELYP